MAQHKIFFESTHTALMIDMATTPGYSGAKKQFEGTTPREDYNAFAWSPWGANNLFPQEMVADIESCGILNAIIDGKARFTICEGVQPAIVKVDNMGKKHIEKVLDWQTAPEVVGFLEHNNHFFHTMAWARDLNGMGNAAGRFMLNGAKDKIVEFQRDDISEVRFEKKDKAKKINNVYYHGDWARCTGDKDKGLVIKKLLDGNRPLSDLQAKASAGIVEHAFTFRQSGWGKHYYSTPAWYAAYKWVKIAQGVPEMKAALYNNIMRVKYMVTIYPRYWEEAFPGQWDQFTPEDKELKRQALFTDINNYLVGAANANKSLFVDGYYDNVNGEMVPNITIEPIEDTTRDGEYLPDSAAANSEIAFSMLFNPAIIGASLPSGPYTNSQGGSNVREASLQQVIMHEPERKMITGPLNLVKYFNGWDKAFPGLEFIIPATILTTTDTGGSSKPAVMGGAKGEETSNKEQGTTQNPKP